MAGISMVTPSQLAELGHAHPSSARTTDGRTAGRTSAPARSARTSATGASTPPVGYEGDEAGA